MLPNKFGSIMIRHSYQPLRTGPSLIGASLHVRFCAVSPRVKLWWGMQQEHRGVLGRSLDALWQTPLADAVVRRHGKHTTVTHPVLKNYLPEPSKLHVVSEEDAAWMIREVFEEECYGQVVGKLPDEGACVVDVGANIGSFALFVAKRHPKATVLCLEPVPFQASALRSNVAALSPGHNVHVVQKGLAPPGKQSVFNFTHFEDVPSCSTMRPEDKSAANIEPLYDIKHFQTYYAKEKPTVCAVLGWLPSVLQRLVIRAVMAYSWRFSNCDVQLSTLTECFKEANLPKPSKIDLLKVDVEGLELHVLQAIEPEWWPICQMVTVEVHDLEGRLAKIRELLESCGFEVEVKSDDHYNDEIGMNHYFVTGYRRPTVKATSATHSTLGNQKRGFSSSPRLVDKLADEVRGQYDTDEALAFYEEVMGGGGGNIHYGIYHCESDNLKKASEAAVHFLAKQIDAHRPLSDAAVMDVGSGTGAAAHELLLKYDCRSVIGFNLGLHQNIKAEEVAKQLGIGERFSTVVGNFDVDAFPDELFDVIWSMEAFCHSRDKATLIKKLAARLRPGGVLGFTDIMAGEAASADQLRTFTDRNATSEMARASDYISNLHSAGLEVATLSDMTRHLPRFFSDMADRIDTSRQQLLDAGISEEYMMNFRNSLRARVQAAHEGMFSWVFIVARKPEGPPEASSHLTEKLTSKAKGISTFGISGQAHKNADVARSVHVVGAGLLGTYIAQKAAQAGLNVVLQHSTNGPSNNVKAICERYGIQLAASLPKETSNTLFFVTTKTFSHSEVLDSLRDRSVCVVHNGMSSYSAPHYPAVAFGGWMLDESGEFTVRDQRPWALHPALSEHAALLRDIGIPVIDDSNEFERLRLTKILVNISASLPAVIDKQTCAALMDEKQAMVEEILNETVEVLRKDPSMFSAWASVKCVDTLKKDVLKLIRAYGDHKPSSVQDYLAGKRMEVDSLNGYVVRLAAALGISTPANSALLTELNAH